MTIVERLDRVRAKVADRDYWRHAEITDELAAIRAEVEAREAAISAVREGIRARMWDESASDGPEVNALYRDWAARLGAPEGK